MLLSFRYVEMLCCIAKKSGLVGNICDVSIPKYSKYYKLCKPRLCVRYTPAHSTNHIRLDTHVVFWSYHLFAKIFWVVSVLQVLISWGIFLIACSLTNVSCSHDLSSRSFVEIYSASVTITVLISVVVHIHSDITLPMILTTHITI